MAQRYLAQAITKDGIPRVRKHCANLTEIAKDTNGCLADIHRAIHEVDDLLATAATFRQALKAEETRALATHIKRQ